MSHTMSFTACALILKFHATTFMTYDSPITCSTGNISTITIEDDIVDSYITSCEDHYALVNDSSDYNHCGMYKHAS